MNVYSLSIVPKRYCDGLRNRRSGFYSRKEQEIFLFSTASRSALEPIQPSTEWVPGTVSPQVKRPGREDDLSPPSSAEVKNDGAIPPLPIYLHGVVLN
jgi:hypothetical protein